MILSLLGDFAGEAVLNGRSLRTRRRELRDLGVLLIRISIGTEFAGEIVRRS
jgi:hypothetical protein